MVKAPQRKCSCGGQAKTGGECVECKKKRTALQRKTASSSLSGPSLAPPVVHDVLRSPGEPLDAGTRAPMEQHFGHDFSNVRVHTDARAAESARAVGARAYTVGRHVIFGEAPSHDLVAHELAHVVQQGGDHAAGIGEELRVGPTNDRFEAEAERVSAGVEERVTQRTGGPRVQRFLPRTGVIVDYLGPIQAAARLARRLLYEQAVSGLQTVEPTLHGYLSAVTPDSGATTIHRGQLTTQDTPPITLDFTFNLDVRFRGLTGRQQAKFTPGSPRLTGSGTARSLVVDMVMDVSSAPMTVADLTRTLFHEGLHMLLFMEGLLPRQTPSPHVAALTNYRRIARNHPEHGLLLAELEVFIELDLQRRGLSQAGYARRSSQEIVEHILEEKFVFEQERRHFGTSFTNRSLALTYLLEGFTDIGVRATATDPNVLSIVTKVTNILDTIDRQTTTPTPSPSTPPSTPAPTP